MENIFNGIKHIPQNDYSGFDNIQLRSCIIYHNIKEEYVMQNII